MPNSLIVIAGKWKLECQLTFLQGPLPVFVGLHGCCKHYGDINGHGGGQTNAPVGANTSYLKTTKTKQENYLRTVSLQL